MITKENTLGLLVGWSTGFSYARSKRTEDEVKQGKNYYIAALFQANQISALGVLISNIAEFVPSRIFKNFTNIFTNVGALASIPVFLFFASVKQAHYDEQAEVINSKWDNCPSISKLPFRLSEEVSRSSRLPEKVNRLKTKIAKSINSKWDNCPSISKLPFRLPKKLSRSTTKVVNFLAEHSGDVMRIGMIVGSLALISLGSPYLGGSLLVAISYEAIDSMGLVPRKISLFMETYMPALTTLGLIIGGGLILRIFSVLQLPFLIFGSATRFLYQKIDLIDHKFRKQKGPTLQEIDAPVVLKKNLDFDEIKEILCAKPSQFKVNPAHCSKWTNKISEFPKNKNFDLYLEFFNQITWREKYKLLKNRLQDDERFMDFFMEKFPGVSKDDLRKEFDNYIAQVAIEKNFSKEQYVADWVETQMAALVDVLKGKIRVKGSQKDLDEAINHCSQILAHLQSIQGKDSVEFEDILVKLAIEGGNYCARGIKRAAGELTNNVFQRRLPSKGTDFDPIKDYELKIERSLQNLRESIVQAIYKGIVNLLNLPNIVSKDTHTFDLYRITLSLGFYPLTDYERNGVDIEQFVAWKLFNSFRNHAYEAYLNRLDEAINDVGAIYFGEYIQNMIHANSNLKDDQKKELLEMYVGVDVNETGWVYEEANQRFQRLMFVILGVLKLKPKKKKVLLKNWSM